MKKIILTCDDGCRKQRFVVDVDESSGDANIVHERDPLIERDRASDLEVCEDHGSNGGSNYHVVATVRLAVEVAP
jgi:hypothetical protein